VTSSGAAGRPAREPLGVPSLQAALAVAVGLVVATVVVVAVSGSVAVRAIAVVLLWLALIALTVYVYRLLSQTGVSPQLAGERAEPVTPLGAGVSADRLRSAAVIGLRDAHALQRGTRHFAEAAASTLRAQSDLPEPGSELIELFDAQRDCAAQHAQSLAQRLHELGGYPSRRADEEAVLAASLYERLLVRGLVTNARHASGLLSLGSATYRLIEHLAAVTGDDTTRSLAERCRRELEPLAERWSASWDSVLDLGSDGDAHETMLGLLEEAHDMEAMHASLLRVTAAQAGAAGTPSGAEDAGLPQLIALVDQERADAAHNRDLLRERLQALHRHPSHLHAFETLLATRATALVEHIRSYQLIRDIRDLLAADELETVSYELLARAADRAHDPDTAALARQLRGNERTATHRLTAELDSALEIALLAE
jgi:hypothetical protein